MQNKKISPWAWIPSLYLIQGIPIVAVQVVSVIMFKRLGLSNAEIALYTAWLFLPWVIKPLWSPFVDMLRTKRWWIVIMQIVLGAAFAGVALSINAPFFVQATLAFFWLIAFSSATHDTAADGFYMLALNDGDQAQFVGIRSTFFRCAVVLGQGGLVILAGFMESATGLTPLRIEVNASPQYTQTTMVMPSHYNFVAQESDGLHFVTSAKTLNIGTFNVHKDSAAAFLSKIDSLNVAHGFVVPAAGRIGRRETVRIAANDLDMSAAGRIFEESGFTIRRQRERANETIFRLRTDDRFSLQLYSDKAAAALQESGFTINPDDGWMSRNVWQPFGNWIARNFGPEEQIADDEMVGNIGVVAVQLSQNPGREVVLDTRLRRGRDIAVVDKYIIPRDPFVRLTFNESNWNIPAYMVFQLDKRLTTEREAEFRGLSGNIRLAWSTVFFILAGLLIVGALWHKFILPKPDSDKPAADVTASTVFNEFIKTFGSFFRKPGIAVALFFMLTYRFAEAQLLALITPFLLDPVDAGGLGLTTSEVGLAYGTFGIIALTLGGIVGGIVASRGGLKTWLWPMTLALLLPSYAFVHLSIFQPESLFVISAFIFAEQFGYGFGFVAYMLFLIYFSSRDEHGNESKNKTAHYAICTGFMALGMMIPRMWSGWLQELIGYESFFWWVMICSIIPAIGVALLKIDPEFGKKNKK